MNSTTRERQLNEAFVMLADTLTSDYDTVELLHTLMQHCTELLDVESGGLLLANPRGELEVVASTSERADIVEVLQLNAGAGPCVEAYDRGEVVSVPDIRESDAAWSAFREAALQQGFVGVHAVPLRLRDDVIGAMGLFRTARGALNESDAAVAKALADAATIGILHERVIRESTLVAEQLQRALESRVLIEQAKGVLAQSAGVDMDAAFAMLRNHARRTNQGLRVVAEAVVGRSLRIEPAAQRAPR